MGPSVDWESQARIFAQMEGISIGQAISNTILSNKILDEAEILAAEPGYAGMKISRNRGGVRASFRHKRGSPKLQIRNPDVGQAADIIEVERSLQDLEGDRKSVIDQLVKSKLAAVLLIDEDRNLITLCTSDLKRFNELRSSGALSIPLYFEVKPGSAQFKKQATITGAGPMLAANGYGCTAGFTAIYNNQRGITTAGHCVTKGPINTHRGLGAGTPYPHWDQQGYDLAFYRSAGHNYVNRVTLDYDSTSYTIVDSALQIGEGAPVCIVIRNGTQRCAYVWKPSASGVTPDGIAYGPWVMIDRDNTVGGDSGGPWLYGGKAFGSHVGWVCPESINGCYSVFMGTPAMKAVGVTVATN